MNINTRTPRCPHCMEVQNGMTGFGIHVKYECKALGRDNDPEYYPQQTAREKALAGSRGPEFAADLAKRLGLVLADA